MSEKLHRHHIIFHRKQHDATDGNKWIRRKAGLIIPMPLGLHDELHENVPGVPPLDIYMARRVQSCIEALGPARDALEAVDNYTMSVEAAMESPHSFPVEQLVGQAAILAIRQQVPFIREALVYEQVA